MPKKRVAECGTKSGFNRHKRTLGEEPCEACREAENAARRVSRKNPPAKRYCGCGKEIRALEHEKCSACRKSEVWTQCIAECGQLARGGNRYCVTCAEIDKTMPFGWNRGKGNILVGSSEPCDDQYACTVHDFCDQQRDQEAA